MPRKKCTDVYGEGVLTVLQCLTWCGKFLSGNFNVEDVPRSGRPTKVEKGVIKASVDKKPANNNTRVWIKIKFIKFKSL